LVPTRSDRSRELARELYQACISADDSKREEGYRTLHGHLLRGARYLASRSSEGDPQYLIAECCQNALLKIHRRIGDCRSPDSFLAWCSTIVIREMHDLQRKATRRETISLDEPIGEEDNATRVETLAGGQDDEIDASLQRQELWRYLIEGNSGWISLGQE
jgi:DNA-directed RNA polymerase specialized sigma24 family protein